MALYSSAGKAEPPFDYVVTVLPADIYVMVGPCGCIPCEHPSEDNVYKVEMISDDQVLALSSYSKRIFGPRFGECRGKLRLQ